MKLAWLSWVAFVAMFVSFALQIHGRRIQREGKPVPNWISYAILLCTAIVFVILIFNFM